MSDPVELLSRLIAVDTHNPGGDERKLCALAADELRARGGEVRVVEVPREGGVTGAYVLASSGTAPATPRAPSPPSCARSTASTRAIWPSPSPATKSAPAPSSARS